MTFDERVYRLVLQIPSGKVATYGQIASLLGSPRSARAVGYALRRLPEGSTVPWWRVLGKSGRITIQNMSHPAEEQVSRLHNEGIKIAKNSEYYIVDIKNFGWKIIQSDINS